MRLSRRAFVNQAGAATALTAFGSLTARPAHAYPLGLRPGLQLGYHNHAVDLTTFGKRSAYEILIDSTDPELVVFEMDCGHMIHAGADPIAYLRKYPKRIQLLRLKDLKAGYGISSSIDTEEKDTNAELGSGVIAWKALFQVAAQGNVKHYFVEHEGAMAHPPLQSVANSLEFLKSL